MIIPEPLEENLSDRRARTEEYASTEELRSERLAYLEMLRAVPHIPAPPAGDVLRVAHLSGWPEVTCVNPANGFDYRLKGEDEWRATVNDTLSERERLELWDALRDRAL